ncbi:zinc-binding protein A33-like [Protopterus annectens]|uniref:zinc-binding protein A33-like n=1 Tax=Protopterus annectens TaxID=7888 RepID=UPI001CFACC10|nr:zinc-binding protein A33-like [Protopterus annectens]
MLRDYFRLTDRLHMCRTTPAVTEIEFFSKDTHLYAFAMSGSRCSVSSLEEDLTCPICHDILSNPATLKCGHNFCLRCVSEYWELVDSQTCPLCRKLCSRNDLIRNCTLNNVVETFRKEKKLSRSKEDLVCNQHNEELKLFCLEDQEAICLICCTSAKHENHKCRPVQEIAATYKEEIKTALRPLQDTVSTLTAMKDDYVSTLQHIKVQKIMTRKKICEEFRQLHQFLQNEENDLLLQLQEEKAKKEEKVKNEIQKVSQEINLVSNTISTIEQEVNKDENSFLKTLQSTRKRVARIVKAPAKVPDALIDVASYLGNLQYRTWKKMLTIIQAVPVVLNPNTAKPGMIISDDLSSVYHSSTEKEALPDNPARFSSCPCILGTEGFTSGKHCWEIDVGNKLKWDIGVAAESINRKKTIRLVPENGFWAISLRNWDEYSACTSTWTALTLISKPRKIKVSLDYDKGELSFYYMDNMTHIYTFKERFTEKLFPYFSPCLADGDRNMEPLRLCPMEINIVEGNT